MIFREEHFSEEEYRSVAMLVESRGDCGQDNLGRFTSGNDCADEDGPSGLSREPSMGAKERTPTAKEKTKKGGGDEGGIRLGNVRRQDVMLRGGRSVIVTDAEAKDRARKDREVNPMPEGSPPGSTADLYDRTFVTRDDPKRPSKITSHDQVFAESDLAQNGTYVSHESVARFLSARHEDDRKSIGVEGPEAIIDTREELPSEQFEYVVEALKRDVDRAYSEGRNPGFYSTDIAECMEIMSGFYPELSDPDEAKRRGTTPEDASFVFTMITAITSNGTDPALNLESADRIYRLYRDHGSVRTPDEIMGGDRAREIKNSLSRFQDMIDEFGEARVRSLMSGVTHATSINNTMKRLAKKSQEIGGSWSEKGLGSSELKDEVVPVAAIFGPKIGSFFANLSGRHQFLTMDRWLMRSVGRVTGELITRSTPEAANKRANEALKAIRARSRSKDILFGVDKPPLNLTRDDVIKSLELQARSGIVEEYGAAYEWAKAAARAYSKVPKGIRDGKPYGSFGPHEDPQIRAAHAVGNTMAKSLIHEQQDPRSAMARRVLRGVFREVAKRVASENQDTRGGVEVSEIQAVLWQYEQNLWKRLGAKTKIEGDSLYSAAAKSLKQRRESGDEPKSLRPEKVGRPKSVRSADSEEYESVGEAEVDHQNQSGQDLWDSEIETSGVDFIEFMRAFVEEGDFDRDPESRNVVVLSNPSPDSFAGEIRDAERVVIRSASFAVWPRLGFDAKIPQEIRSRLPEHLSHASTLLDLHATREGTEWWAENGSDVDMELDLRDASTPQAKVFFRCLDSDAASLDGVWEEIWESEDLDDYCGDERRFLSPEFRECGQDDLGRFSSGNDCAGEDGGGGIAKDIPPSAKQASKTSGGSGGKTSAKNAWKKDDNAVVLTPSQSKVLAPVKAAMAVSGRLVSESLNEVGVSLDDAATACASLAEDSTVVLLHGDAKSFVLFTGGAELSSEPEPEVTFVSQRPFAGVESGLISIASIARNDEDELSINYALFGVKPEAQKAAPVAVAREMYRGVFDSIANAEKIGVKEIVMKATGDSKDDKFKGYRIWPRLGFDGVIPRKQITPTYSLKWGFFDAYGSSLPDSALSPRAKKERAAGALTVQALYETKEGQDWWEKSGGTMDMIMRVGDEDNPGWQRYKKISSRISGRDVDYESILDAEWRSIREEVESRSADCGRDDGGMFASGNDCASGNGVGSGLAREPSAAAKQRTGGWGGGISAEFGQDNGSAVYTPERPLFKGAEDIGRIEIATPKDVREVLADTMRMTIADAVLASGAVVESPGRARISKPRVSVTNDSEGVYVEWSAAGAATGSGYSGEEKKHAERPGTIVNAVHASRLIYPTDKGAIVYASGLGIHPDFRGMGIAVESVLRTISSPVARVNMDAVRFDSGNPRDRLTGYSIWPKYGYDAPVSKVKEVLRLRHSIGLISSPDIPEKFRSAKTLSDIYAIPGGKEWWAQDGDSIFLSFDVRPRSRSMTTMLDYKARTSRKRSLMQYKNNHGADVDDDAEVLDQIWEKYQKEGLPGNAPTQEEWDEWDKQDAEIRKKAKDGKAREV